MSVTKILLRHNSNAVVELPGPETASCCEPLFFKNKLYIRSQKAEELVDPGAYNTDEEWDAAVAQYRLNHPDGEPVFIGPYEHPARQTGSQLAVNVSENTQSQNEDYIYTSHDGQSITDAYRVYRAITGIVTDKDGHIITAEAGLNIQVHSGKQFLRFWDGTANGDQTYTPITVSTSGTGHLPSAPNVSTKFSLPSGVGHLETTGKLLSFAEAVTAGTTTAQNGYTWSLQTGDCIPVTDADWASHMAMGLGIDGVASYNHQLVRSNISFDTADTAKYLRHDGQWGTPQANISVAASPGDTSVKGVITGSVSIDGEPTEFTVQPANSYLGGKSGAYYYTGQGVVRPLGTTTGMQTNSKRKVLYASESTEQLNKLNVTVLTQPLGTIGGKQTDWAAIPVYVDYHKVEGTDRVEAVPYIMLPLEIMSAVLAFWGNPRIVDPSQNEGTEPKGQNVIIEDGDTEH